MRFNTLTANVCGSLVYSTGTETGLCCKKLMRLVGISSWSIRWILLIFLRYLRTASRHCDVKAFGFPAQMTEKVTAWNERKS